MGEGFLFFNWFALLYTTYNYNLVPFIRKNMLNDLLRFDVKDCSWCR